MHNLWTWSMVWGLPDVLGQAGGAGWMRAKGENLDNCKSTNNKI